MRARGYTLVEVLVAVLVFAVLAAAAYTALEGLSRAAGQQRDHAEALAGLQLMVSRLEADLRQLSHRARRTPLGQLEPAFSGSLRELAGVRSGWSNPAGQARSDLQRFAWQFDGQTLTRLSWPVTDPAPGVLPAAEDQALELVDLRLRYRDALGSWSEDWPARGTAAEGLPSAIEVLLETRRFGLVRRLLVLSP